MARKPIPFDADGHMFPSTWETQHVKNIDWRDATLKITGQLRFDKHLGAGRMTFVTDQGKRVQMLSGSVARSFRHIKEGGIIEGTFKMISHGGYYGVELIIEKEV